MPTPAYIETTHYNDEYQHIEKVIRCYRSRQRVLAASARVAHAQAALRMAERAYTYQCQQLDVLRPMPTPTHPTISDRVRNILGRAA